MGHADRIRGLFDMAKKYRKFYDTCRCEWRLFDEDSYATLLSAVELAGPEGFVTVCYNTADVWPSRDDAIAFFMECMYNSEGAENDRYQEVYLQAMQQSCAYAHDGVSNRVFDVSDRR